MANLSPIAPSDLRRQSEPDLLDVDAIDPQDAALDVFGQERAVEALRFGLGVERDGYNVFAMGVPGTGRHTLVTRVLEDVAAGRPTPDDWCYVHNFGDAHQPVALRLPAGRGNELSAAMDALVEELRSVIPAAFDGDEYRTRLQEIQQELEERHTVALRELQKKAEDRGIALVRTPGGFVFAPMQDEEILSPDEFSKLPKEKQEEIESTISELQAELKKHVQLLPRMQREGRERTKQLAHELASTAIEQHFQELRAEYADLEGVVSYLEAVEGDVIDNVSAFRSEGDEKPDGLIPVPGGSELSPYRVNILVDRKDHSGAPVIYENNPRFGNLMGRIEHRAQLGALVTDFSQIRPGALHRANGGYLLVEARKVLSEPFAWEGLKRALRAREVRMESVYQGISVISTSSLDPEPIPLDLKVVIVGERRLYYLLAALDPDFAELFKVVADFEDEVERTPENTRRFARLLAHFVDDRGLRPLDKAAALRIIDRSARISGDAERLSTHRRTAMDLLTQADYFAAQAGRDEIRADDVNRAIEAERERQERPRRLVHESIARGTVLIDTTGSAVGQVNGLSVVVFGPIAFGQPSRITATARLGKGEVVDIMREVEMGGAQHSKGVLILGSYLASQYAKDRPLSLHATLVFEQSYGMVDGDSASMAELCALLSALSGVPIKQSLAITGSVNQRGQAQAIGGVNEKIEGFFDVCAAAGLTGEQGVIIPAANRKHLMLREDVVGAADAGQFHVYAVDTVDEAVTLLTDTPAGEADEAGQYPEGSINALVEARLKELLDLRHAFIAELSSGHSKGED